MGRSGDEAFARRRATSVNPAASNIRSVPRKAFAAEHPLARGVDRIGLQQGRAMRLGVLDGRIEHRPRDAVPARRLGHHEADDRPAGRSSTGARTRDASSRS